MKTSPLFLLLAVLSLGCAARGAEAPLANVTVGNATIISSNGRGIVWSLNDPGGLRTAVELSQLNAAQTKAVFRAFMNHIERSTVPAAAEVKDLGVKDGLQNFSFAYDSAKGVRVPGLMIKAAGAKGRLPVVILLHGTGGYKEELRADLEACARAGFLAVAIDAPYDGERTKAAKNVDYQAAIVEAWRTQKSFPFFYETVWDVMRLLDYLETREDVDAARIGLGGISKGGIETYITAGLDPRIAVAVPCIAMESFDYALKNNLWSHRTETIPDAIAAIAKDAGVNPVDAAFVEKFYNRVAPGINGPFDGPAMARLIAPRPMLIIVGEKDLRTPAPAVQECMDAATPLYKTAGAEDKLKLLVETGTAHAVTPAAHKAMIEWFTQWLKPEAPGVVASTASPATAAAPKN